MHTDIRRVIYISNARLPTEKAHGLQTVRMCDAFAGAGMDVTLVHPHRRQNEALREETVFSYYGVAPSFAVHTISGIDLMPLVRGKALRSRAAFIAQNVAFAIGVLAFVWRKLRDENTLIYGRDPIALSLISCLGSLVRARVLFEVHTLSRVRRSFFPSLFRGATGLVVLTTHLKTMLAEAGMPAERIHVEPDAVELADFTLSATTAECRKRLGVPSNRSVIGYIGRFQTMGMEKGIPQLIEAVAGLAQREPMLRPFLLCVGGPIDRVEDYLALAERSGLGGENVRFQDRVPHPEVPYWIRACDVVTIPWPWTEFSAYFTSPMKMFEYMAAGVPIVASRLPALEDVLTHDSNAVLHAPGDVDGMTDSLFRVVSDAQLARRIARKARTDVGAYTWKCRAQRIIAFADDAGR